MSARSAEVLQVASLLLQYPDAELCAERPAIAAHVEALPDSVGRRALQRFVAWWRSRVAIELQQDYVATFDTARRRSLYLTYPVHGDRRERGSALLLLKRRYAACGFALQGSELPDFLPVMLEFAAQAGSEGVELLHEHRSALELLHAGLREAQSPYVHVLDAVSACLPRATRAQLDAVRRLAAGGPPGEQVGLEPFAPPEFMPGMARTTTPR